MEKQLQKINKQLFRARLVEQGLCVRDAAHACGINETTMYRRLDGKTEFTLGEIRALIQFMHLTPEDATRIFGLQFICQ